jgi:uncharacterized protein YcbK (DUF882 family)
MISKDEILMGRDQEYPEDYTQEISDNIDDLLGIINEIRDAYGKTMVVTSGWRPPAVNDGTANAAKKSNHMKGLAVDIKDVDGKLWQWVLLNLDLIKEKKNPKIYAPIDEPIGFTTLFNYDFK